MMMVHLYLLNCVHSAVRDNPRYAGDHVIRHYRSLGLAALLADLGLSQQDSYTVTGGIGTLTMYADGREDWQPTITAKPTPPRLADPAQAAARQAMCDVCSAYRDGKCLQSGCGCTGEGKPATLSSICPLGRWPSLASPISDYR